MSHDRLRIWAGFTTTGLVVALVATYLPRVHADSGGRPTDALWGLVSDGRVPGGNGSGVVILESHGVTNAAYTPNSAGYLVDFDQDVTACSFTVTPGILDEVNGNIPQGVGGEKVGPNTGQLGFTPNTHEAWVELPTGQHDVFYIAANCP